MADFGAITDLIEAAIPIGGAVAVALIVSGREDRRARSAEARTLQRQSIIALQDAWLDLEQDMQQLRRNADLGYPYKHSYIWKVEEATNALGAESKADEVQALEHLLKEIGTLKKIVENADESHEFTFMRVQAQQRQIEVLESRVRNLQVRRRAASLRGAVQPRYTAMMSAQDEKTARQSMLEMIETFSERRYQDLLSACSDALRELDAESVGWLQRIANWWRYRSWLRRGLVLETPASMADRENNKSSVGDNEP